MEWTVAWIIGVYFLIGAVAVARINRRSGIVAEHRERWVKYGVYALIVNGIVWSMEVPLLFRVLVAAILLIALLELLAVWLRNAERSFLVLIAGILIFAVISGLFYRYSLLADQQEKQFVYVLIFTFDGFSQIAGQLFGRRHFAPVTSPNKTIEGTLGGFLFAILTAFLLQPFLGIPTGKLLIAVLVICVAGLTGDLLASAYKRRNSVKDYSHLLPGHGGILDRFDSYIVAGAAFWLLVHFF